MPPAARILTASGAPTGRARCEPVLITGAPVAGSNGDLAPTAHAALRVPLPPICRALPEELAEALLHYAARYERVAGSGGGLGDPSGVRSTVPSAGPTIGKLVTAEELRHMDAALAAVPVLIRPGKRAPGRMSAARARAEGLPASPPVVAAARDLVVWFVIGGDTAIAVLRRLGLADPTAADMGRLRAGVERAAQALRDCIASGKAGQLATL